MITIDGPAGSGKSTVSRQVAKKLGASFLDTGAMYRAVTLSALQSGVNFKDPDQLIKLFDQNDYRFQVMDDTMKVWINGQDVTEEIRKPQVTENVKYIANDKDIRGKLVEMQREFASHEEKIVTEGRDQGTVVFPDADKKFFLNADVSERAKRRHQELINKGHQADIEKIKKAISERDKRDENRIVGPLKKAADAIEIDTTSLTVEQVVKTILDLING